MLFPTFRKAYVIQEVAPTFKLSADSGLNSWCGLWTVCFSWESKRTEWVRIAAHEQHFVAANLFRLRTYRRRHRSRDVTCGPSSQSAECFDDTLHAASERRFRYRQNKAREKYGVWRQPPFWFYYLWYLKLLFYKHSHFCIRNQIEIFKFFALKIVLLAIV